MIHYRLQPTVNQAALRELFEESWPETSPPHFEKILPCSLTYAVAYSGNLTVGFVNVAWDGGKHAFVLDLTVRPPFRRRGIATELLRQVCDAASRKGIEWIHVDFEPHLEQLYRGAKFTPTTAGIINTRRAAP